MTTKRLRRKGWTLLGTVASNSSDTTEYEIRRDPATGTLGCACMGWAIRKECSHLDAYISTPERAASATITIQKKVNEVFTVRRAISFGGGLHD